MNKKILLCLLFLLTACGKENALEQAREKLAAAKDSTEREAAVQGIKRIAEKGNVDAQVLYLFGTNKCSLKTDSGNIAITTLKNRGNTIAMFLLAEKGNWYSFCSNTRGDDYYERKRKSQREWLEAIAKKDYFPAKIALSRVYFYRTEEKSKENFNYNSDADILASRQTLQEAITIAKTTKIDALQKTWAKEILTESWESFNETEDPLLRIYRLQLLTLIHPDWHKATLVTYDPSTDKQSPAFKSFSEKVELIYDISRAKYKSMKQLPFDEDAQESIAIADELLSEAEPQIALLKENAPPKGKKSLERRFSQETWKKYQEKATKQRLAFAKTQEKANQGDSEALWDLYVKYKHLPMYWDEVDSTIEKMMDVLKNTGDERVIGTIASHMLIRSDEKRKRWLRECANYPNAKCMRHLADEIIYRNKNENKAANYAEGVFWIYKAMEAGDKKAEAMLKKSMEVDGWVKAFFAQHYEIEIPDNLACHAATYIESKQVERKNAWFDEIFPKQLLQLYEKGAKYGDQDCINRINEHNKAKKKSGELIRYKNN